MEIPIYSIGLQVNDVVLLYDSMVIFAESVEGTRYISDQARCGQVPFATLAVPNLLHRSALLMFLRVYRWSDADVFAARFVYNRDGVVFAAQEGAGSDLPEQEFWRAIAALYRFQARSSLF